MAEPDIAELNIALTMAAGCLERDGRPNTAFVVRQAIAALEDRDRLRAWMESDYLLGESFAEWAALEGRDG